MSASFSSDPLWQTFPDALLRLDSQLSCLDANAVARTMLAPGVEQSAPLAEFCAGFVLDAALREAAQRVLQTGCAERAETLIALTDRQLWLDVWLAPVQGADGLVLVLRDISHFKQSEARLRGAAERDALTGLLNHAAFHDEVVRILGSAQEQGRRPALVLFDLDYLKNINDAHGHRVGDQAIRMMAETLRVKTRSDDAVGRLGGDEFAWVLPDGDLPDVVLLAQRVLNAIQSISPAPGLFLSASVGVAGVMSTYEPGDLFDRADAAVYDAKAAGRGVVSVANATDIGYESRRRLEVPDERPSDPGPDLTTADNMTTAARAALREWVHVLAASGGCIDLLDQQQGWVQACAYYRFGHDDWTLSTTVYRLDDYPSTAAAIAERRTYTCRVDDPEADPAEQALLRERGFASLLLTPLMLGDRVLGIVELFDTRHRTFTTDDQRTALALAHHLAPLLAQLKP
jgi:diguanylate cyclase (GGDEF)-like protein